jgi:hypothetical protein
MGFEIPPTWYKIKNAVFLGRLLGGGINSDRDGYSLSAGDWQTRSRQ